MGGETWNSLGIKVFPPGALRLIYNNNQQHNIMLYYMHYVYNIKT